MTDATNPARIAEGLSLAEQVVSDPHHPRCSVHDANACDCYRGSRRMYVIAEALVAQQAELERLRQALVDLHESLFIGSERGLSRETLAAMASFAKSAALAGGADAEEADRG